MSGTAVRTGARSAAVLSAGVIVLGAAACSSSDDGAAQATGQATSPPAATQQQPTQQQGGQPGGAPAGQPQQDSSGTALHALVLNGADQSTDFPDIRCEHEHDEGFPQIELEAKDRQADRQLQVEIVMSDPPKLDDFELEQGDDEWQASDRDRAGAQITVDGQKYHVSGPVTQDDTGAAGTMDVEFTCG